MTDPLIGTGLNQYVPFATGVGANVETPTNWIADLVRQQGFQNGIANPTQANTVLRQASFIAAMIAQFSADFSSEAMVDDGNLANAEQVFVDALRRMFRGVYFMNDTGTANAMAGTDAGQSAPTAYDSRMVIVIKKTNTPNSGPMTANFWGLGAVSLGDNTGAALSSGALIANSYYILTYAGSGWRVLGGVAQYTSVTNLTANSGDMISVTAGTGVVDFRTLRGTHDAAIADLDRWPRGKNANADQAVYVTSLELLAWIQSHMTTGGAGLLNIQVITASGTYTKTAGTTRALVFASGGGGAGGMHVCCAGGGGAGATAVNFVDLSAISTVACTIGAGGTGVQASGGGQSIGGSGGTTTFGSYASAGGGQGGQGIDKGGNGGVATVGKMLINGGDGMTSYSGNYFGSGNGGPSFWGGGGGGADTNANTGSGYAAKAYGSGGGGGDSGMPGGGRTGGNGAPGVILVIEFGVG